jgi:hypothetical protein
VKIVAAAFAVIGVKAKADAMSIDIAAAAASFALEKRS